MRCYGNFERRTLYPHFTDVATLYRAMVRAGVEIRPEERAAYLLLARQSIETKKHHKERIRPGAWEKVAIELATFDDSPMVLLPFPTPAASKEPIASISPSQQQDVQYPAPNSFAPAQLSQQQEIQRLFVEVAGELGSMLSQLASLSQRMQRSAAPC